MAKRNPIAIQPLASPTSVRMLAYDALKEAISNMDIYDVPGEIRLDERRLSQGLGISRTPVREALSLLEHEGFVRSEARRGAFVARKSKDERVSLIQAWTALECMAARLACEQASDAELAGLRAGFPEFDQGRPSDNLDAYAAADMRFHQTIIAFGRSPSIEHMAGNLLIHVRGICKAAFRLGDRAEASIREHVAIIEALEARDVALAERRVRDHGLDLARHVARTAPA